MEWQKESYKKGVVIPDWFSVFCSQSSQARANFLRRLIDLSTSVTSLEHYVYLNTEARADLLWWKEFLLDWNGVEFLQDDPVSSRDISLFTDASDLGFGCVFGNEWTYGRWPAEWLAQPIFVREFFGIWVAVRTWGYLWVNKQILIHTDNMAAKDIWEKGTAKNKVIMLIVRVMFMYAARNNINILLKYIPGKKNVLADLLSRLQVTEFLHLHPNANAVPTIVPEEVWQV